MRILRKFITTITVILVLLCIILSNFTNFFPDNVLVQYIIIGLAVILGLNLLVSIYTKDAIINSKSENILFSSLLRNSDTAFILVEVKTNKVIYISDNIETILGISIKDKDYATVANQIFNIPIIKSEIKNWNKTDDYISQIVEYDNPKYNHQMWIRIKIFDYKEKSQQYYVIRVTDATSEHNRQHLLISQASNIKAREGQLAQITSASYDMEINVNLNMDICDLKYFKNDNLYFGDSRRGSYTKELNDIANKYINENDREMFYSTLSLENLKDHFNKYELDSISIRYRLGNELKNNIWLESTIFFLSNGQRNKVSILTKNVTESAENIREQNVLLQNALNDAKIASKAKTDLISTISHDIRTPLTNIIGLSDSLLSKDNNDNVKDDIKTIKTSSVEVLDIIDGLLDVSKVEKKVIEKEEINYSIFKLFNRVEEEAKEYLKGKPVNININLDSNLPVILFGDYKRILKAINEIVNNSIKYTDEGEININVRGEKTNSNVKLIVEVEDTGCGLQNSKLNEIMNYSESSNKGIGYVKGLMKLLDGKLEVESKVNDYTKVTMTFMQQIVEDNKVREMMNNNNNAEEFDLTGKKILIVDDNRLNLKVTSRLLEPYSLDITLLESGEECVDLVKEQNNFDLIMLDQMMPGMSGTDTLNKLREIDGFKTPIVVLTADAMDGQREKYLSDGFDDYISKPIDRLELSRVLKKFLKNDKSE